MPNALTKFKEKWLEEKDGNGNTIGSWCTKGKTEWHAFCILCKSSVSISNAGVSQLKQNASSQKHITASKLLKSQRTLVSCTSSKNNAEQPSCDISLTLTSNQCTTRAEALWAIKVAVSNYSFASCKDIVPLFQNMFPDYHIPQEMQLSDRKISYVISHGLGPYFHEQFVLDLKTAINSGCFYTVAFDETTTSQIKKQLDIFIRFWSPKFNRVISGYLTSLFFGHANADAVLTGILDALETDNLPLSKMLMLSMDGPNVNLLVAKKLNEKLSNMGLPELLDLGTCTLHKVHNCFSKSLDCLPLDIDEFATDLFIFFKVSAARREDLKGIEQLLECEEKFLLRHVNSRWLTLGPVVDRIISTYKALEEYFLKFLPKQKSNYSALQKNARFKRISSTLKDPSTIIYLEFLSTISITMQSFLAFFQTEGPVIHMLYSKMNSLLRAVMLKFIEEDHVRLLEGKELIAVDLKNHKIYRPLKKMDVGIGAKKHLLTIDESKAKEVRMAMRTFMVNICLQFKDNLPLSNLFLRDLEKLHPLMKSECTEASIQNLCMRMKQLQLSNHQIDKVTLEWMNYKMDPEVDALCKSISDQPIDQFWANVLNIKGKNSDHFKYENLGIVIKNCLSLSHGNADVERGFSCNKSILADNRSQLSESALIGLRNVKDSVRLYGEISSVPITVKMLKYVEKAHGAYTAAKEAARLGEESKRKRELEEAELLAAKKLKHDTEEKMKKVSSKIKNLQEELVAAQNCLSDGNSRLQDAIKAKDFSMMKIASSLIEVSSEKAQKISKELNAEQEEKYKLQSSLKK